jgi:hypothetical protein
MTKIFCLTDSAILVLNEPAVKLKIMYALDIFDPRTIQKHLKNNLPDSPLLNINVREIIRQINPKLQDEDIFRKMSKKDLGNARNLRNQMQSHNAYYNNRRKTVSD